MLFPTIEPKDNFSLQKHEKHYFILFLKGIIYLVSSHVISGLMYTELIIVTK